VLLRLLGFTFSLNAPLVSFVPAILIVATFHVEAQSSISNVKISRGSFNPSLNESVEISFHSSVDGQLTFQILDRDGYVVRTLASNKSIQQGVHRVNWDGRNTDGLVVPDEAYSIKIDVHSGSTQHSYFPGDKQLNEVKAELTYYDRQSRILSYKLPKPARVHIQAGSAVKDPKTGKGAGPVLRTLVNREPRTGGSIIEHWTGFDESGTIQVPELTNFVFSVFATELPENSIICIGNRNNSFLNSLISRKGRSYLKLPNNNIHGHHRDLSTLYDISPAMILRPLNAVWSQKEKIWIVKDRELRISGNLEGPTAEAFSKQPGSVGIFVDEKQVSTMKPPGVAFQMKIRLSDMKEGPHYIAVNWGSQFGPVAVNSFRIRTE
jgi:hypothetical protein